MVKQVMKVSRSEYDFCSKVLAYKGFYPNYKATHIFRTYTTDLGDGIEVDINVVNGDTPYVDAVLYDHGVEMLTLDPVHELLGDYTFDHFDEKYVIHVDVELPAVKKKNKKVSKKK